MPAAGRQAVAPMMVYFERLYPFHGVFGLQQNREEGTEVSDVTPDPTCTASHEPQME